MSVAAMNHLRWGRRSRRWLSAVLLSGVCLGAMAQEAAGAERSISEWLTRIHDASRGRSYTGTLVVTSGSSMSTSRIWHVCNGVDQMEKVETLTGSPRITIRRNNHVITFDAESRHAFKEQRDSLGLFPELLKVPNESLPRFYELQADGTQRVAGHSADVINVKAKDDLRYGYRIWAEQKTGLVVKLQTLGDEDRVLEQVAFTELKLNAPVRMDQLQAQMKATAGYQLVEPALTRTTPEEQGWRLKQEVPGFVSMSCHVRALTLGDKGSESKSPMHWVFSDGLASVSLFIEAYDSKRHQREGLGELGATHSLSRKMGDFWVTVLGEVPPLTLKRFAESLERIP